ncbi:MAG: N,N-dimethylformamidase beta subunit family domain-containing protein, partial [Candidatus Binataceae bacterium]
SDTTRAVKVSFDRPNIGPGLAQGLPYEIDAIRWLERRGYDVSYVSSVDLAEHPELLLQHKAYLNLGHDEYWSRSMRDGIQQARDAGVGLAFLGANDGYWQIRFDADSHQVDHRTIICYKEATTDPLYGKNNALVTTTWRDGLIGRPENALIGIMYSTWSQAIGFPWQVSTNAASALLAGTSLKPGATYGCDYVGYEWDRVFDNGETPAGLHILGDSRVVSHDGTVDVSNTAYYVAPSGALVFAAGSIYWSFALDDYRVFSVQGCDGPNSTQPDQAQPGMQRLLTNVLSALITRQTPGK